MSFEQYIPTDSLTLIFFVLALATLLSLGLIFHLHVRLKRLLRGDAKSIEGTLLSVHADLGTMLVAQGALEKRLADVERRQKKSIQGISTIRFNPFKGTSGSNQSFVTAFVDEEGDGVVLSSLYSRERVSLFGKPIKKFTSEYELTEEEKEAITQAQNSQN